MGQSKLTPMFILAHVFPSSIDRKPSGLVPAKIVLGSTGSTATDHICSSSMGDSSFSQVAPLSSLRNMPTSEPASTRLGSSGYTAIVLTVPSVGMGCLILVQVSPQSELTPRP